MDPRDARATLVLRRRYLTAAGTACNLAVPAGAARLAVVFARREQDAAYGVAASASWATTVAVTAKSATGCTLAFGTAAPAGATVDVAVFRSE